MKKIISTVSVLILMFIFPFSVAAQNEVDEDYYPWCENGHTFEVIKGKEATCTESGLTDYVLCTTCGWCTDIQQVILPTGHNFCDWIEEISPTVSRNGLLYTVCDVCGVRQTRSVLAIQYTPGDYDNNKMYSVSDARTALRKSVGLEPASDFHIKIGDLNADGMLTVVDARILLRIAVGLEQFTPPPFPED